jgi:hypothetical protein
MRNTADVTGSKPFAIFLQSISGVIAINPLVAFYDIHGGKREVLFFFVPDTTRDQLITCDYLINSRNFYERLSPPLWGYPSVTCMYYRDIVSKTYYD